MGKIAFITSSIDEEYEVMPAIEQVMESDSDLEAWVLPPDCTPEDLKRHIIESAADVFVASSIKAEKLAYLVAACTGSPVVALPLKNTGEKPHTIFTVKGVKKAKPAAIVGINDTKLAAELAVSLAEIAKPRRKRRILNFLKKR